MNKLKKGNRVEFTMKGKIEYGVVTKGGAKKIKVTLDGGEHEVSGHASLFRLSDHPLAKDLVPSPMDKYSIAGSRLCQRRRASRLL